MQPWGKRLLHKVKLAVCWAPRWLPGSPEKCPVDPPPGRLRVPEPAPPAPPAPAPGPPTLRPSSLPGSPSLPAGGPWPQLGSPHPRGRRPVPARHPGARARPARRNCRLGGDSSRAPPPARRALKRPRAARAPVCGLRSPRGGGEERTAVGAERVVCLQVPRASQLLLATVFPEDRGKPTRNRKCRNQ